MIIDWFHGVGSNVETFNVLFSMSQKNGPVLEVLDASEAFEPPVHHDAQSGAQSFTLLHAAEDSEILTYQFLNADQNKQRKVVTFERKPQTPTAASPV